MGTRPIHGDVLILESLGALCVGAFYFVGNNYFIEGIIEGAHKISKKGSLYILHISIPATFIFLGHQQLPGSYHDPNVPARFSYRHLLPKPKLHEYVEVSELEVPAGLPV